MWIGPQTSLPIHFDLLPIQLKTAHQGGFFWPNGNAAPALAVGPRRP